MTDFGLTSTGFLRKTYADLLADIEAEERERIYRGLDLSEKTFLGNLNAVFARHAGNLWELLESVSGGLDPDNAPEELLVGLCKLTGVVRQQSTYGEVYVTLTATAATEIDAGALTIRHVDDATNLWTNVYDISLAAAGEHEGHLFRSISPGAAAAAGAGTLTVMAAPVTGISGVTNPEAATPGEDVETVDALRIRRERSLARQGKGSVAAIASEILAGGDDGQGVAGVIDCQVLENDSLNTSLITGMPGKSVLVLIWDGIVPAAVDAEIAAAIYRAKGAGVYPHGDTVVQVPDPWGRNYNVRFTRMTGVEITIAVTVEGETNEQAVKDAIMAYGEALEQGTEIKYNKVVTAIGSVEGVDDVTSLTIQRDSDPPVSTNVDIEYDEKALFDEARITVTVV